MHTVTLTTTANANQVVKINRTSVEFTPAFIAKIAKLRNTKYVKSEHIVTIGKYSIQVLGNGKFAMYYTKNGMGVCAAIITIAGGVIVAVQGK